MGLLTLADQKCSVEVDKNATKPNASVPGYIPPISSLRYIFTHCLDIRRSPGRVRLNNMKNFLCILADLANFR